MKFEICFDVSELIESGFLKDYPDNTDLEYGTAEWTKAEKEFHKQLRPKKLMKLWKKLDILAVGFECESADEFDENVRFHMIPACDILPDNIPANLDVRMY
jgi:hypothetical protein